MPAKKIVPKVVFEVVDVLNDLAKKNYIKDVRRGAARWLTATKLKADMLRKKAELEEELEVVQKKLRGK
jgi:hypothetical protein